MADNRSRVEPNRLLSCATHVSFTFFQQRSRSQALLWHITKMGRLVLPRSALVSIDPIFFLVSFIAIRQTYSKYRSIVYTPTMAYSMLESGLQALILCGPGNSFGNLLNTEKTPKCLALVANRPMVYYSLDFSKRSGITGKSPTI